MKLKDKKIIIYKATYARDRDGNQIAAYTPIHTGQLWAYFRQLSGKERFSDITGERAEEEVVFSVNWRDDIKPSMLILFKNVYYDITRIDTYEGYKTDLSIYAKTAADQTPTIV